MCGQQYALNLYTLAEAAKARVILEVGAGWGWSGRAFAQSLRKRDGMLISLDPVDRVHEENRLAIEGTGIAWARVAKKSGEFKVGRQIDLLYVDGNPDNVAEDVAKYYGSLRDGGLVVVDGCGGQSGPTDFVSKADGYGLIPYSDTYSHGVHRKPAKMHHSSVYRAACEMCSHSLTASSWSNLDEAVDEHVCKFNHRMQVFAGPHGVSYVKAAV